MKRIIICSIFGLAASCTNLESKKEPESILAELERNAPYSVKEYHFFDSIHRTTGFDVSRNRTFIGATGKKQMYYSISLSNRQIIADSSNINEYVLLRDEIVKKLYEDIIEDSVLYDLSQLKFSYEFGRYSNGVQSPRNLKGEFSTHTGYSSEELEDKFGFKVIKTGKGFSRKIR